ncbi:MAG TPA: 4Fe-4S dicluster domain-containing protein [Bacteroidales bacterium]
MKRTIIKIDEALCNGCGQCVKGCHEGALQLINDKATIVSELYCDGLGACIGECPVGAISLEELEAEVYNESAVMERFIPKGEKVIQAHLKHLFEHDQSELLQEAVGILRRMEIPVPPFRPVSAVHQQAGGGGCPGSRTMSFAPRSQSVQSKPSADCMPQGSELQQWPVQLHLLSPTAPYLKGADLLVAADCTAYAVGDFHSTYLKNKRLAIACPKLDHDQSEYVEKITTMIDKGGINTLTVMIMEVPCCGGLLHVCEKARNLAQRAVPIKLIKISVRGELLEEKWL